MILNKKDPQVGRIQQAIEKAIAQGIEKGKFTAKQAKASTFTVCLRDGDPLVESEERPAHYKGKMFMNCSAGMSRPGMVDENVEPVYDPAEVFYSGCRANVDVNIYPYAHPKGGKGVACWLNNVMFAGDDERLDGRQKPEEAFSAFKPQE